MRILPWIFIALFILTCDTEYHDFENNKESLTKTSTNQPQVLIRETIFNVEIADTVERRTTGLSGRKELDTNSGMLFLYQTGFPTTYWMKDMLFPLDIIWIAQNCRISDISQSVPFPRRDDIDSLIPRVHPKKPSAYVLEINSGKSKTHGFKVGDKVEFTNLLSPFHNLCE